MPNQAETAVLIVAGVRFEHWESVWVQDRWTEGYPLFRFTAAEYSPIPGVWTDLQFKPGDPCQIVLAGQIAVEGYILERQVAYDANSHAVQLSGVGLQYSATQSSVEHATGNFDGKDFETVAKEVLAPFPVRPRNVGEPDKTPFKELQLQPGELVWDFLERLARVRKIVIGSDTGGNFLIIGDHHGPLVQDLIEGINILKMQCVIKINDRRQKHRVIGQKSSHDEEHGRETKEPTAVAPGMQKFYMYSLTPAEQPVTQQEMTIRVAAEQQWREWNYINATITVQGWLRQGGQLWKGGDVVFVRSPMATLAQTLTIKTATFTQDSSSGTLTTLECVSPNYVNDRGWNVGAGGQPDLGPARSDYWEPATTAAPHTST